MSEEGDKTCPLCAEEMDLTDQQLKPCKCGYEICVWCWHHIMDMAEKDKTEGRCPACRTPYNKERIVGMAADCGKLVAEMSVEKKKSQKGKSKASEGRKQLSSVRVIQKNVVYVVGLPLNLADEDLLQRKEYFGQYGKVHKVSISRTAAGTIQQYPHSTCSVYITYSKEEEAVRCIQAVHGFVLEGRPLKACFGTTKYCHAWLRNVPCSNPECLYLHEVGLQEDSYTKDEIVSAYTRVEQITGNTNSMQVRVGNVLPPPTDDYCNITSASSIKLTCNNSSNNPASCTKVSPPNSSSTRSVGLPAGALWGTRSTPSNGNQNQSDVPNGTTIALEPSASSSMNNPLPPVNDENRVNSPTNATILAEKSCGKDLDNLCSDVSSMDIKEHEEILCKEYVTSYRDEKTATSGVETYVLNENSDASLNAGLHEIEDDVVAFNNQRVKDPELVIDRVSLQNLSYNLTHVNNIVDTAVKASDIPVVSTGYKENQGMGRFQSASGSRGENSIISNILSLDFDPWEEPLSSRQSLAKMLADNDHHQGSLLSSPRRVHSSSQSRFSFAREEQCSQAPYVDPSLSNVGNTIENGHFSHDFTNDRSSHFDKYITHNGFSSVSRPQVSAPPGFSPSNRAPPPGFTSTERVEQSFDPFSGNHLLDTSSLLRNRYQASTGGNMVSSGDIEFMDPAILAVGKGRLPVGPSFSSQYNTYENEARLQLLMERSLPPQQNNFAHLQDAYNIPSRVMEQSFTENLSPFAQLNYPNGHWKGYGETRSGNEFAMSELLRNERLGYNNLYAGQEDPKFRIPNSGDIYKRTFGL